MPCHIHPKCLAKVEERNEQVNSDCMCGIVNYQHILLHSVHEDNLNVGMCSDSLGEGSGSETRSLSET